MFVAILSALSLFYCGDPLVKTFSSLKEMTASEKQDMKSNRYHVFRLKREVQKAFLCQRCKGTGSRVYVAQRPKARGWAEEVQGGCEACSATGIRPVSSVQDKLDDYCRRKHLYEKMYAFAAPVVTGLEAWMLEQVRTLQTLKRIHVSAYSRLAGGNIPEGRAVLAVVEIFNIVEENGGKTYQATMWRDSGLGASLNLMLVAPDMPKGVKKKSCILGIMFNAGGVEYENMLGDRREARVLTVVACKDFTGKKMPWD